MAKFQYTKGSTSVAFLGMVVFLVALSVVLVSGAGYAPSSYSGNNLGQTGSSQIIVTDAVEPTGAQNLQLRTFRMITIPPSPTPAEAHACQSNHFNTESQILVGSDPGPNGTIGRGGKIRVWVVDEGAPFVAPGATADPTTGAVTNPGLTSAKDTRNGANYSWSPAVYLTKLDGPNGNPFPDGSYSGDAEHGGVPNFPDFIKGAYNNGTSRSRNDPIVQGAPIDEDKTTGYWAFENGPDYIGQTPQDIHDLESYPAQFEWLVDKLTLGGQPLTAGNYRAQFVIHDGDKEIGIDCFNITL